MFFFFKFQFVFYYLFVCVLIVSFPLFILYFLYDFHNNKSNN